MTMDALGALVGEMLVKSSLVLVAAFTLRRAMRGSSAASRHMVWTAAFVALLSLAVARLVLPAIPLVLADTAEPRASNLERLSAPAGVFPAAASADLAPDLRVRTSATPRINFSWPVFLAGVWLVGAIVLQVRVVRGWLHVRRLATRADDAADPSLLARARDIGQRLRIRRHIRVLIAEASAMPATWGVFRPTIVLPSVVLTWPQERVGAVLLHELAHVSRLDSLRQHIARFATTLFWPHPLVWWASKVAHVDQERACDDLVLAHGVGASRYCEHLLAIVRGLHAAPRTSAVTLAMARETTLEQRVRAILDPTVRRATRTGRSVATGVVLIALALPLGAASSARTPDLTSIPQQPVAALVPAVDRIHRATELLTPALVRAPRPTTVETRARVAPAIVIAPDDGPSDVTFSGTWVPVDVAKQRALYDVGLTWITPDGMSIVQSADTMTVSCHISAEFGAPVMRAGPPSGTVLRETYQLDGSDSTNGPDQSPVVGRAIWEGDRIVIRSPRPRGDLHVMYSLEGQVLKVVSTFFLDDGRINSSTLIYRRGPA